MWVEKISKKYARFTNYVLKIWTFFVEFCDRSNIHGIRYFTERRLHWSERIWWAIAFVVSVWLCGLSVHSMLMQWHNNPVTMDFTGKETSISAIPFPTVVICSGVKVNRNILDLPALNKAKRLNSSALTDSRLQALAHICDDFSTLQFPDNFTSESIYDTITRLVPPFNTTLQWGFWKEKRFGCCKYFAPIFTGEGLCFAFNALNSNEMYTKEMAPRMMTVKSNPNMSQWNFKEGYTKLPNEAEYPFRISHSGDSTGLKIHIQTSELDLEYICKLVGLSITISLTVPGETFSSQLFEAPLYSNTHVAIKPQMITTSNGLRNYGPEQRKCFYQSERRLRFFKMYTQANCEEECLANLTKNVCGCVKFSMPRDINTKICGAANIRCYLNVKNKLYEGDISDSSKNSTVKSFREKCNCWPACTSIKYDADVTSSKLELEILKKSFGDADNFSRWHTAIHIFFRERLVDTLQRTETYTYTNFLGVCGGLLGLFLGISLLSIIELIYYSTLRFYWTIRRSRSENVVTPFD